MLTVYLFVILVAVRLVQLFHLYQTLHNGFGKHTDDWRVSCVERSATESCTAVLNTVSCSFISSAMPPGPGWVWRLGCAADDGSGRAASEVGWCGRALTTSAIIIIIIITDATISNIISALHVQSQHSHSSVKLCAIIACNYFSTRRPSGAEIIACNNFSAWFHVQ